MHSVTLMVVNPTGIHARPASDFVKKAKEFRSKIKVRNLNNEQSPEPVNAKSIISVLSIEMCLGDSIEICAQGEDERRAAEELAELVRSGFGEI